MKVGEEKIIETAYTLFTKRGVRSTTMHQIAKACSISLWDVNLLFKSKQELVLAVVRYTMQRKTAHLLINASLAPSAVTELNTFFKFVDETIGILGAEIFTELKRYNPPALDQLQDIVDGQLIPCLQKNVLRGLTEGFYREGLNADLFASTYFHFLRTVLESKRDWIQTRRAIAHINDIFLHGVLNVKGMRV